MIQRLSTLVRARNKKGPKCPHCYLIPPCIGANIMVMMREDMYHGIQRTKANHRQR